MDIGDRSREEILALKKWATPPLALRHSSPADREVTVYVDYERREYVQYDAETGEHGTYRVASFPLAPNIPPEFGEWKYCAPP